MIKKQTATKKAEAFSLIGIFGSCMRRSRSRTKEKKPHHEGCGLSGAISSRGARVQDPRHLVPIRELVAVADDDRPRIAVLLAQLLVALFRQLVSMFDRDLASGEVELRDQRELFQQA